jgi:dienelactone hydrolase
MIPFRRTADFYRTRRGVERSWHRVAVPARLSPVLVPVCVLVLAALLAGCGGSSGPKAPDDGIPRLEFAYDADAPLGYADRGRINKRSYPIAVHDVSFKSQGTEVQGYLLLPPHAEKLPAVVLVHGSGGDRNELLGQAAWLAARNVVTLTITEPSTSDPPAQPTTTRALIEATRQVQVRDVIAVRRAVDALAALDSVDGGRIGYIGWSAGARTGTFVAASEPRVKALVLLSAGAAPLSAFVKNAPAGSKAAVKQGLGSVDPLRYIAWAQPGSVLLEDGRRDEVVPQDALRNVVKAAPEGTQVKWYAASHALNKAAYGDAFDWLAGKLPVDGPRVKGAATETTSRG